MSLVTFPPDKVGNDFAFNFFLSGVFGSLQTSLLCIMRELAGRGSVAVSISDKGQVTRHTQHVTNEKWHVTCDI